MSVCSVAEGNFSHVVHGICEQCELHVLHLRLHQTGVRAYRTERVAGQRVEVSPTVRTCPGNAGVRRNVVAHTSLSQSFVNFEGDGNSEMPRELTEPVHQVLGLLEQFGRRGISGASLLAFIGAMFVLPANVTQRIEPSLAAAITSI